MNVGAVQMSGHAQLADLGRRKARNHQVGMSTKRRKTMNPLATLAMTTVSLFVGVALLAVDGIGYAQQRSDSDNVNAAVNAFHAALSNLDIGKMQNVWAQEPYVVLINPRDKAPAVGWEAVKKDWQDGVFGFWAELKLSPKQAPHIHVDQTTAWTTGVVGVEGKNKSGQALSFTILETQVYEKRGDRWLMVSHHASRVPE
jgi:ketosteroid isomerase-like protein